MRCRLLMGLVGMLCLPAFAENAWQSSTAAMSLSPNAQTQSRGLPQLQDDITPDQQVDQLILTPAQLHEAAVWNLTSAEEKRYVFLMQNKSSVFYADKHLTPVWILGLNARTDAERNDYAALAVAQEEQMVAQNLAWNAAFTQAYRQQTAGMPLIKPFDYAKFSPLKPTISFQSQDILNLFIRSSDKMDEITTAILSAQRRDASIKWNLFFIDNPSTAVIEKIANHASLPVEWVKAGRITLTNSATQFQHLNVKDKKTPLLIVMRQGQAIDVDTGRL